MAPNRESIMQMAKDLVSINPNAVNPFNNENSWQYRAWSAGAAVAQQARKINDITRFNAAGMEAAADVARVVVPTPVAEHIRRLMADAATCADPMRAGRLKRKAFILTARHATI